MLCVAHSSTLGACQLKLNGCPQYDRPQYKSWFTVAAASSSACVHSAESWRRSCGVAGEERPDAVMHRWQDPRPPPPPPKSQHVSAQSNEGVNCERDPNCWSRAARKWEYARNGQQHKVLVVMLTGCNITWADRTTGRSYSNNSQNIVHAMGHLRSRTSRTPWDCMVIVFDEPKYLFTAAQRASVERSCDVVLIEGGQYVDLQKAVLPSMVRAARYTHVLLMQDDVYLEDLSLDFVLPVAHSRDLAVFSPWTTGFHHDIEKFLPLKPLHAPGSKAGIHVTFLEAFDTFFRADAWECWWELSDPLRMSKGWHDFWMYDYCRQRVADFKMGILSGAWTTHLEWNYTRQRRCPTFNTTLRGMSAEVQLAEAETRMSKLRQPWQKWRRHDARNFMHAWS